MNRTHIKWLPIFAALAFVAYQYFTSEKFVNPETGRASHVGLSTQEEAALGLQSLSASAFAITDDQVRTGIGNGATGCPAIGRRYR